MAQSTKVAIVTGSNKGIGYAIVRSLSKSFQGNVYLTSRDVSRGHKAIEDLKKEGLNVHFRQLDVENEASILELKKYIVDKYGGLDLLVNNAGIAFKNDSTAPFSEQAEVTLKCNYWGLLSVCNHLFPILRSHARVVHVSSTMGHLAISRCSEAKRKELLSCDTIEKVSQQMKAFVDEVKAGTFKDNGWPETSYGISKTGVTLLVPIQQKLFDADKSRTDIIVNASCPGYVATDMSSWKGTKTIDEGADTPVFLSLLPAHSTSPKGNFVRDKIIKNIEETVTSF